jgi:phenylalanyl-tRNA synthetase alpha chain
MSLQTELKEAIIKISEANTASELQQLRVKYLGRKGLITGALRSVGTLPPQRRAKAGQEANQARKAIEEALNEAEGRILDGELAQRAQNLVDPTVPAEARNSLGHLHPVTQTLRDIVQIFWQMGYEVVEGPEVENEWYNFESLLIPPDHPARDMQDTFYLEGGNLPRTHTSGMQIRYMEKHQPPIRIISPGRVYRNEDESPRHSWIFHQVEGLVVDKGIRVSDLKGTLLAVMKGILGEDTDVRLRQSYFPYTEPSLEVDATCVVCTGKGGDCKMCSGTGWLELGGAGMVHPHVLLNAGIDPEKYSGFAFGFGPDRITTIKMGITDIRELWRPNLKFLEQF